MSSIWRQIPPHFRRAGEYRKDYSKVYSGGRGGADTGRNEYSVRVVFCNMGYGIK